MKDEIPLGDRLVSRARELLEETPRSLAKWRQIVRTLAEQFQLLPTQVRTLLNAQGFTSEMVDGHEAARTQAAAGMKPAKKKLGTARDPQAIARKKLLQDAEKLRRKVIDA